MLRYLINVVEKSDKIVKYDILSWLVAVVVWTLEYIIINDILTNIILKLKMLKIIKGEVGVWIYSHTTNSQIYMKI